MNRVNYAIVIGSQAYKNLICATLKKCDVTYMFPKDNEEQMQLLTYVKQNTADLSNYDAIIIDLGVLADSDGEMIEAIESIRYWDDKIRVIIIEGIRTEGYKLLHQCCLNGIYNLIPAGDYINIKESLEKCVLEGMTYKDALMFRDMNALKKTGEKQSAASVVKKEIALFGTQCRIGVTHCTISAAYSLRKNGYLTAVVDCSGGMDYHSLMASYGESLNDDGFFSLEGVDFFIKRDPEKLEEGAYNFILYDSGQYSRTVAPGEARSVAETADEIILLCGGKPWEIPALSRTLEMIPDKDHIKYLFNYVSISQERGLKKMMRDAGINEKDIFIMDHQTDPFEGSSIGKDIFDIQQKKIKKGKGLFRRQEKTCNNREPRRRS